MEMNDAVWVLAAVFSGLSSYYYARRHPNAGSSRPLFDDVIPLQDTSKIRQLKQLKAQLKGEQENFGKKTDKFKEEIDYLQGQIQRIRNNEIQEIAAEKLMREMEDEISEGNTIEEPFANEEDDPFQDY